MYIRTKDEINLLRKGVDKYIVKDSDYSYEISIDKDTLLKNYKVADTIEELCDRYVGISNNEPMIIKYEFDEYYDEYNDAYTKEELIEAYNIIYGAIYTDKGLIYVAKMNESGNLELL